MAVVNRPRNNLEHHLAWFNTQKPQVPPRTQNPHPSLQQQTVAIANLPLVLVNPEIPQPTATNQNDTARAQVESSSMPTPANLRSSKLAAPRRSEPKPKKQEKENIYPEVPAASAVLRGNSLVERVKNDWVQEGKSLALTT